MSLDKNPRPARSNRGVPLLWLILFAATVCLSFSSCETMEHWLFNASDYSIFQSKNDEETDIERQDQYMDDLDYDIWYEENEYD